VSTTGIHATGPVRRVTSGIPAVVAPPPRIAAVIRHVAWVGIAAHAGFVAMFALLGHPRLAAFNVLSVATWIAAAIVNRRGRSTAAMWLLTIEVVAHAALAVSALGWSSGFQYYLIPLIPFVMFNDRLSGRAVVAISVGVFAALMALRVAAPSGDAGGAGAIAPLLRYGNLVVPVLALALVSFYFRRASTLAEQRMESMALTDPLTGLLNRRSMEQRLREAALAFQRTGRPFGVVMADVDHFKRINDVHGHLTGDEVLREVAALVSRMIRTEDVFARYGGEEFVVVARGIEHDNAGLFAERIRGAVERLEVSVGENLVQVTISVGFAALDELGDSQRTAEGLIRLADARLYGAKAAGRNRTHGE
jgi:diguanylate cyclase (GGDEF)-like protein